jgi:hypothetical protein
LRQAEGGVLLAKLCREQCVGLEVAGGRAHSGQALIHAARFSLDQKPAVAGC